MGDDKRSFHSFVSALTSRPHISESVIARLSLHDIANCLRASKDFRRFITDSLKSNQRLKNNLDDVLSRLIVTTGTLEAKQHGPLKRVDRDSSSSTQVDFGFGLDDSLWLIKPADTSSALVRFQLFSISLNPHTKIPHVANPHRSNPHTNYTT